MGLRASQEVRFARGQARTRRWCAVKHRVTDWAARSCFTEEFEVVIMIKVVTEEMHGSDLLPCIRTKLSMICAKERGRGYVKEQAHGSADDRGAEASGGGAESGRRSARGG